MKKTNTIPTDIPNTNKLFLGIELSKSKWVLCFHSGSKIRRRSVPGGAHGALLVEIHLAKEKLGLPKNAEVHSCYEAGRDGFWLHRFLCGEGIINHIFDSSSIEVNRRQKQRKNDRIDAEKLVTLLIRKILLKEQKVCAELRVPSTEQEAEFRINRERSRLVKERGSHSTRIKSLLVLHGIHIKSVKKLDPEKIWDWEGKPLPKQLVNEITRELKRYFQADEQIKEIEADQRRAVKEKKTESTLKAAKLIRLKGVGLQSSWLLSYELFWREFRNRKELGGCVGLAGSPYDSGQTRREQGISKTGSRRVRTACIELAWGWLRFQPNSKLSLWFFERFARGNARQRRIGIVALARKLVIALWKYIERDEFPEGATLKIS